MTNPGGRRFRDGLNYQHNLAAARNVIDAQNKDAWDENIYMNWLACLRELCRPTTDEKYPESMRTRAWAMKTVNTQLASWCQLRHDTILYVKQSYTGDPVCFYPAGFVEPVPPFWARLEKMATRTADLLAQTPFPETVRDTQKRQVEFLKNFAAKVAVLRGIAEKELAQKELTKEEAEFLKDVVEIRRGGSGPPRLSGWYPGLFYNNPRDCIKWDALVADVHTDVPAPLVGDPGCVLHQGVGQVDLMVVAIDNGKDRMVYLGPVFSHYEFEMPGVTRKTGLEWQRDFSQGVLPPRPAETASFLIPRKLEENEYERHGGCKGRVRGAAAEPPAACSGLRPGVLRACF
jgi:hypothetical protein